MFRCLSHLAGFHCSENWDLEEKGKEILELCATSEWDCAGKRATWAVTEVPLKWERGLTFPGGCKLVAHGYILFDL